MQPEARLAHKIRLQLTSLGAFVFKVHGSGMMKAGLPDLIVCHHGEYIGVEVKMPGNKPSKVQEHVHRQIKAAGGRVIVAYSVQDVLDALFLPNT
jgi:Holliday junction resolvase